MNDPGASSATGGPLGAPAPSIGALVGAVALRPVLWATALVVLWRLARPGWWRRWPPVPRADPSYWRFRMETAYGGDGSARPAAGDVVAYLRWCRRTRGARARIASAV